MITLLGSLLGFLGAAFPEILKIYRDKADKAHELSILDRQMELQREGHLQRLEAISMEADIAETKAIYRTYNTKIRWVDALNGTVRPVLAYAFFFLYVYVKFQQAVHTPWLIWQEDDQAIFAGIISFYYGQRAMQKFWNKPS
ncbi:MAG: hypothetical protein ACPG80_00155 [Rickettsiales bacterium]